MKRHLSTPATVGLTLLLAITLALMSVFVERTGPELAEYGNLCGAAALAPCHKPVLKGGYPVAYLFDAPGVSVERKLSFGEDQLSASGLIVDVAIYFAASMLVIFIVSRGRSGYRRISNRAKS